MSTTRTLRASTIANSFKAQMSCKNKSTPNSSPLRPVGQSGRPLPRVLNPVAKSVKSAATVALSKDASPEPSKSALDSSYGERLAHDHPDAPYWLPLDNVVSRALIRYFDSEALPTDDTVTFFDSLRLARPHFVRSRFIRGRLGLTTPFIG
jgi:hypothetical protein